MVIKMISPIDIEVIELKSESIPLLGDEIGRVSWLCGDEGRGGSYPLPCIPSDQTHANWASFLSWIGLYLSV